MTHTYTKDEQGNLVETETTTTHRTHILEDLYEQKERFERRLAEVNELIKRTLE